MRVKNFVPKDKHRFRSILFYVWYYFLSIVIFTLFATLLTLLDMPTLTILVVSVCVSSLFLIVNYYARYEEYVYPDPAQVIEQIKHLRRMMANNRSIIAGSDKVEGAVHRGETDSDDDIVEEEPADE